MAVEGGSRYYCDVHRPLRAHEKLNRVCDRVLLEMSYQKSNVSFPLFNSFRGGGGGGGGGRRTTIVCFCVGPVVVHNRAKRSENPGLYSTMFNRTTEHLAIDRGRGLRGRRLQQKGEWCTVQFQDDSGYNSFIALFSSLQRKRKFKKIKFHRPKVHAPHRRPGLLRRLIAQQKLLG